MQYKHWREELESFRLLGLKGQPARVLAAFFYVLPMMGLMVLWAGLRVPFMRDMLVDESALTRATIWPGMAIIVFFLSFTTGYCLSALQVRQMFCVIAVFYIAAISIGVMWWGM